MSLNMRTLTQALAKTAAVIEKTVQTTVQEVTGPKPLQDYDLIHLIGSAGPGLAWKLYSAKSRSGSGISHQYPTVCVWVLDKKSLSEARIRAGLSKAAEDSFLDIIRADAARLVRLRHPGVVHVVQALDESKNAMAMVTEPLFASVANTLGNVDNIADVPKELKGMVCCGCLSGFAAFLLVFILVAFCSVNPNPQLVIYILWSITPTEFHGLCTQACAYLTYY